MSEYEERYLVTTADEEGESPRERLPARARALMSHVKRRMVSLSLSISLSLPLSLSLSVTS